MRRFFVVGMPRSGTTLLQTLIGSSGEYYITHESHLPLAITECFDKKFGIYRWVFQIILGVKFFKYFKCIYFPLCEKKSYIKFDDLMTKNAKSLGFSGYVEKTPSNLYVVEKLFMYIKNVKIIYISRSPGDNVKSYLKYSVFWNKIADEITLKNAIKRFYHDTLEALYYEKKYDDFYIIMYNKIIDENNHEELYKIEDIIQTKVHTSPEILADHAKKVVGQNEHWKTNNLNGVILTGNSQNDYWSKQGFDQLKKNFKYILDSCQ